MKTLRAIIVSLVMTFMLHGMSFGQVRTVASGDTLVYEASNARQVGNQPIEFPDRIVRTLTINIEKDGSRNYFWKRNGQPYNSRDKGFVITSFAGKPLDEKSRFKLFPQDKKLEPGMEWDVPSMESNWVWCEPAKVAYHAASKNGPDINLLIDDKDVAVKTILINYKARVGWKSHECAPMDVEVITLYSPELEEIVGDSIVRTDGVFLKIGGWKYTLKSIQSAK